jgi:uncharacterized protein (TIGR00661 family)
MKILYGVAGEGLGHGIRSKCVIEYLLGKHHDLRIVTSGQAYDLLSRTFPTRTLEIRGFRLAYKNGRMHKPLTVYNILKNTPRSLYHNAKKYRELNHTFFPHLVISDFESFASAFALRHRLPIISIDSLHVSTRCDPGCTPPLRERVNFIIEKQIIRMKVPACDAYFIPSFFDVKVKKKKTIIVPPILREEIIRACPVVRNHTIVYLTVEKQDKIVKLLRGLPNERFYVYGFNREEVLGNICFKAYSEKGFLHDLVTCKAVITHGGFNTISEAIYLGKPVCINPIPHQLEQYVSAINLEKLGYGRMITGISTYAIQSFLNELPLFQEMLKSYSQDGNNVFYSLLDREIDGLGIQE